MSMFSLVLVLKGGGCGGGAGAGPKVLMEGIRPQKARPLLPGCCGSDRVQGRRDLSRLGSHSNQTGKWWARVPCPRGQSIPPCSPLGLGLRLLGGEIGRLPPRTPVDKPCLLGSRLPDTGLQQRNSIPAVGVGAVGWAVPGMQKHAESICFCLHVHLLCVCLHMYAATPQRPATSHRLSASQGW